MGEKSQRQQARGLQLQQITASTCEELVEHLSAERQERQTSIEKLTIALRSENEKISNDVHKLAKFLQEECNVRSKEVELLVLELSKEREARNAQICKAVSSISQVSNASNGNLQDAHAHAQMTSCAERTTRVEELVGKVQGEMDSLTKRFEALSDGMLNDSHDRSRQGKT